METFDTLLITLVTIGFGFWMWSLFFTKGSKTGKKSRAEKVEMARLQKMKFKSKKN